MDGGTGLLNMPSAEMNPSGTFSITNNMLNEHSLPPRWDYCTFGYGLGIAFWSRVEVNYVCTIFNSKWSPRYPTDNYRFNVLKNQDRHFSAKLMLMKDGEAWKWTPSVAVGISDPLSAGLDGEYFDDGVYIEEGNGYFNRMYIVSSKHFNFNLGEVGVSLGYQFNFRQDHRYNAPCAAVTWRPMWIRNRWFDPKFILEFDARTPNIGFIADIWDNRFEAMFCLQNFQWVSFGLRYKLRLKGAES